MTEAPLAEQTAKRQLVKKTVVSLALVALGICAGIALAEGAVRLLSPQPLHLTEAPGIFFIRHDRLLGWANREGAEGSYQPDPSIPRTTVRINREGYRGSAVGDKGSGRRRILFLGDSNTFGYGVEERERFSETVAAMGAGKLEQVNLGVFGYGTDQEALQFESVALPFRPDVVVLGISAGDLSDSMSSVNGGAAKPFFKFSGNRLMVQNVPVPVHSPYLKSRSIGSVSKRFFYDHSHLYRLLVSRLAAANRYMSDAVMEMTEGEGLQVMTALIAGMRDSCSENGIRFVALLIPHGVWLEAVKGKDPAQMPGYFPALKRRLAQLGVEVADPTETLLKESTPVFFAKDPVHLTARGNAVIGGFLYARLAASSLSLRESVGVRALP